MRIALVCNCQKLTRSSGRRGESQVWSHVGKPRTAENAWVWYCGYMKLCPGQVLVAGGMWKVEEEKGTEKETAALLATPRATRTLKSTGAHCWGCGLMRRGRQNEQQVSTI